MKRTAKEIFNDDKVMAEIGRAVAAWAVMEFSLDALVSLVHGALGGRDIQKKVGRHLEVRLEFVRLAFDRLPALTNGRTEALALADEIQAAAELRHDLVHGIIAGETADSNVVTRIIRWAGRNFDTLETKVEDLDQSSFADFRAKTAGYTKRLNVLAGIAITDGGLVEIKGRANPS